MASQDIASSVKVTGAFNPAAALTANAANNGVIIDTQGFESVMVALQSGVITDGAFAYKLQEGDVSNLSDAADVATTDYITSFGTGSFALTDDNVTKKIGYRGAKRYVRVVITQSGATTGGFISALAILSAAKNTPVA